MTKYCEILRLHSLGFSARNIALAIPCSRNTVSKVLKLAAEKGGSWPLPDGTTDAELEKQLSPSPPSDQLVGVHIHSYAVIATNAIVLSGIDIAEDTLVAACANVTRNVEQYQVVGGNPAKLLTDIRKIKNKFTGEDAYPWKYHYSHNMPWEGMNYAEWYHSINL